MNTATFTASAPPPPPPPPLSGAGTTTLSDPPPSLIQKTLMDCSGDGAVSTFSYVNSRMSSAFDGAMAEINQTVGDIGFNEMFRPTEHQEKLRAKYVTDLDVWQKSWGGSLGLTSPPIIAVEGGTSSHEAGYSFDIPTRILNGKRGKQIIEILAKHGFTQDVPGDVPHFTWVAWGQMSDETKKNEISLMQKHAKKLGLPGTVGAADESVRAERAKNARCQ